MLLWLSIVCLSICLYNTPTNSLAAFRWIILRKKEVLLGLMTPWRGGRSGTVLTGSFPLLHTIAFFFLQGAPISSHKSGRELNCEFPESRDSPLPTGMTVSHFMPLRRSARAECVFSYAGSERGSLDKSDASGERTVSKSIHTVQDIILLPLAITQSVRWITQNWSASVYLLNRRVHRKDVWEPKEF